MLRSISRPEAQRERADRLDAAEDGNEIAGQTDAAVVRSIHRDLGLAGCQLAWPGDATPAATPAAVWDDAGSDPPPPAEGRG